MVIRLLSLSKVHASGASAKGGDNVSLLGSLGLDIVREPVAVVARESLATRHGGLAAGRPHLLDVVVVAGVNDGGDIEVGEAVPGVEVDLTEHAGDVGGARLDGVEVTDPGVGELDNRLLLVVDGNRLELRGARARSEVDGTSDIVESPEGDTGGADGSSGGNEGHGRSSEMHFECCLFWSCSCVKKTVVDSRELASEMSA